MSSQIPYTPDLTRCLAELRDKPTLLDKIRLEEPAWTWPVQMSKYAPEIVAQAVRIARGE